MADGLDIRASMERGLQLLVDGRHVEAFDAVAPVAEAAPGDPRVWELLGTIALAGGRPGVAFTAFERCHSITGDLDSAMNMVSAAYHGIDLEATRRSAAEAVAKWPDSAEARAWDAKMRALPDEHAMMVDVGRTLYREGRFGEALAVLVAAIQVKDTPEARLWAGRSFLASGDPSSAASFLRTVTAEYPEDPAVAIDTATAFASGGRRDIARAYLDEAARVHPGDAEVMEATARLLIDEGRYDEALRYAESATRTAPGRAGAWYVLALCLEAAGRTEEARLASDRAIGLDPDEPYHWGLGARLVQGAGDAGLAARYRAAAARAAGAPSDWDDLPPAGPLAPEVEALYEQIRRWPEHVLAYRDRATIGRLVGEYDRALYYLDLVARDLVPEPSAPLLAERAVVLLRAGREGEAREALTRALDVDPSFAPARETLDALGAPRPEAAPSAPPVPEPSPAQPESAQPRAAFCVGCGARFAEDADFCVQCGARRP